MSKVKIKQYIFPKLEDNLGDYNENTDFASGKKIKQLGIYALPGTIFQINGEDNRLVINGSGILQIDGEDVPITSLKLFNYAAPMVENHFIIIDMVYEEVE